MGWESSTNVRSAQITFIKDGKHTRFHSLTLHTLYARLQLAEEASNELTRVFCDRIRKNFERHFQESRHAFGMRALGLPNTKHFHEITRIEDAIACASLILRTHPHPFADVVHRIAPYSG